MITGKRYQENNVENNAKKFKSNNSKLSKNDLYKPPTVEELNQLKETEILFNSNLFRLQTEELLKEIRVKEKRKREVKAWMEKFQDFTNKIPEYIDTKLSAFGLCTETSVKFELSKDLKEIAKNYPLKLKTDQDTIVKLKRPCNFSIIGLYNINAIIGPTINLTLNIIIPKSCFMEKDYLNSRYIVKRALYLSYIAFYLKKEKLTTQLSYTYMNENHLIPILNIIPANVNNAIVKIQVAAEENTFKLSRFHCDKSNLRYSYFRNIHKLHKIEDMENNIYPTPFYNAIILYDLTLNTNDTFCNNKLGEMKGVNDAIMLLIVWLKQRELIGRFGGFNEHLLYCLLAYLVNTGKINKHMSSYQIIRHVWNYLSHSEWNLKGPTLCENEPISITEFYKQYNIVFIDRTGYYNIAANLNYNIYQQMKYEANIALNYLNEGKLCSFQSLFMTKMNFYLQFDVIINIEINSITLNEVYNNNINDKDKLDYLNFTHPLIVNHIINTLQYGLSDRITNIVPRINKNVIWDVGSCNEYNNDTELFLTIGLNLNHTNMYKIVNKGPEAYDKLSSEFQKFWGNKTELRRFKDGSISEAVVWDANNINEKRNITKLVIEYIFKDKIKLDNYNVVYNQFDVILNNYKLNNTGVEEANLKIINDFDVLSKKIRDLNLPLSISTVQGISDSFCHSDANPPTSMNYKCGQKITCETENNIIFKNNIELKIAPSFVAPVKSIIQMVEHSKWPNDLNAIRQLCAAFYLQMAEQLNSLQNESFRIRTNVNYDYLDVLFRGIVYRFNFFHPKQIALVKKYQDERGVVSFKDTSASLQLEMEYIIVPKIIGTLNGIHSQYPSYGPGTIIMKRWIRAQLLDETHVPSIVISLLSASLYVNSAPFKPPSLPQIAFLRFLQFFVQNSFNAQLIIINFNNEINKQQYSELDAKFQQNRNKFPPICIITPFDLKSIITKNGPSKEILNRLIILARESLNIIEKNIYSISIFNVISLFKPNLNGYNIKILLQPHLNPRRFEYIFSGISKNNEKYRENNNDKLPIINFNPVELYLKELRKNYSNFALFFHDTYGGDVITVLWKPKVFEKHQFKIPNVEGKKIVSTEEKLKFNTEAIIEDFYILGNGIVKNIEIL